MEEEFGVPPLALLSSTASVNAITEMIMPIMKTLYAIRISLYLRPSTTPR